MNCKEISVAKDFSKFPSGRFIDDGPYSGEQFRKDVLVPCLEEVEVVTVWLEDTPGYGSSFLEEAFGGLVRENGYTYEGLKRKLKICTRDEVYETYIKESWDYIKAEDGRR